MLLSIHLWGILAFVDSKYALPLCPPTTTLKERNQSVLKCDCTNWRWQHLFICCLLSGFFWSLVTWLNFKFPKSFLTTIWTTSDFIWRSCKSNSRIQWGKLDKELGVLDQSIKEFTQWHRCRGQGSQVAKWRNLQEFQNRMQCG